MDTIQALSDMRAFSPATVTVAFGVRDVVYAVLWDSRNVCSPDQLDKWVASSAPSAGDVFTSR